MSIFLGKQQQSAFKTLSTWDWSISDSRNEVNAALPRLPAFTFISRVDGSESIVDDDEPTITSPRINHAQLPSEAFEIVLETIQRAAPELAARFVRAAAKVAALKAAEAMLVANTPAPPLTRSAATSGITTPGLGLGMHAQVQVVKPPRKKPGPKPKPYARINADGTTTLEPAPELTVSETTFRKSQHISPKSFVFIRDAYLNYWSGFQAHKRSYTTEEVVPDYPVLGMIGADGSTERKFRLAVGLYLAREGKIPTVLVDGQRDTNGSATPGVPKKRGRPKKVHPFAFGRKPIGDASGSVSGTATPMEPTSAESNASGEESSRLGSMAPRESSQVSDATSSYYNSPLPSLPLPPALVHQPHSFDSTVDHLTLASRGASVESSTRPATSSNLQHSYPTSQHPPSHQPIYPQPPSNVSYRPDPPSAQV